MFDKCPSPDYGEEPQNLPTKIQTAIESIENHASALEQAIKEMDVIINQDSKFGS